MNRFFRRFAICLAIFLASAFCAGLFLTDFAPVFGEESAFSHAMPAETNEPPLESSPDERAKIFADPVGTIRTGAYYYWLSGNVSSKGVAADIQAMKSVGIDRAQIGDIGVDDIQRGAVRTFSPAWWDAIHTALKTATEEDVEIGIFNSPGWSQSGGPWVNSKRAMRYLTGETIEVSGPKQVTLSYSKRTDEFQDVKVLAFRRPKSESLAFEIAESGLILADKQPTAVTVIAEKPFTARSLTIQTAETPIDGTGTLEAKIDGEYKKIAEFKISRYNPNLSVGFTPFAPVVATFAPVTASEFRLSVQSDRPDTKIAAATLESAQKIACYPEKTLAKMHQTPQPMWPEYQWPLSPETDDSATVIDPATLIDLTASIKPDQTLDWDAPEGDWVVFWTGMVPTGVENAPAVPEATGYETDKMSREHIAHHFDSMMGEILRKIPEADRKSFKIVVQDSYEVGGQNFTDGLLDKFATRFGYDPTPYLPAWFGYVVGDSRDCDRFLWDLRRFIADEIAYSYVGGLRDVSNANGLKTWLECYGHWGFPGEFLQYGGQSDEIAGEYWSEGTLGDIENRIASSCGHIYGKRKIWSESNTCAGNPFSRSPIDMKIRTDRFFAEGINQSLLHLYVQQPDERVPGFNAWFGNEFNRHNTWFSQLDLFTTYLKRANYLLQQGTNVADVAYFIGEDAPKMTGAVDPPLPAGYQYDFINAEVLLESAFVRDGLLTLPHGTQYELLVLPKLETMRPELLRKIEQLVTDGAVVLGPKPTRSPSLENQPQADADVKQIADRLWADIDAQNIYAKTLGEGLIANGLSLEQMFDQLNLPPDCAFDSALPLAFAHRTLENAEIYFIANQSAQPIENAVVTFRVEGKTPRFWFPTDGQIRDARSWQELENGRTSLPLAFAPQESYFVVFEANDSKGSNDSNDSNTQADAAASEQAVPSSQENFPAGTPVADLSTDWTVRFDSGEIARGPNAPVLFPVLTDWSTSENPAIRFYSGTAVYEKTFTLDALPAGSVILSLGKVSEMAKVTVNGQYQGGVWTAPFELDVTGALKVGENTITIEAVNTWVNRLVGDAALSKQERKTWAPVNPYTSDSALKPSGLLGPVVLRSR